MEWFVQNERSLRETVQQKPWRSWFLGLGIYSVVSLVPGTSGKSVLFGWIFGFWRGVLLVDIGLTFAAVISFLASRHIMRDTVTIKFEALVNKLNCGLDRDGPFYLLLLRLAHVPFTIVNYGAGVTSISLRTFTWTTATGILPGTMIFVFIGARVPTLESLKERGIGHIFDPLLLALLAATFVFPVCIRWAIHRIRRDSVSVNDRGVIDQDTSII